MDGRKEEEVVRQNLPVCCKDIGEGWNIMMMWTHEPSIQVAGWLCS